MHDRDLAIVLSGEGMNGLLLELGFLRRLREDPLWERVGWVYGTSAGALSGVMAVRDRLDELEEFVLELRPEETFRPNRLWQLPFTGLHDYALPGHDRRAARADRGAGEEAAGADRARRVRHRRPRRRPRRAPRVRADLLEPHDAAGGHGAGGARVGRDQRARPSRCGSRT